MKGNDEVVLTSAKVPKGSNEVVDDVEDDVANHAASLKSMQEKWWKVGWGC